MIKLLTVCDSGYTLKGLAMHKSLCDTIEGDFVLFWLCLDEELYENLRDRHLKGVVLFRLSVLEDLHNEITYARTLPATQWGGQASTFVWTLCVWFYEYVLNTLRDDEVLLYVDSDIYFYESPQLLLDTMKEASFGIHTHRFSGPYSNKHITGYFNVGVVGLRHDPYGIEIARKWKGWMMQPDNEYSKIYGRTGDQGWVSLLYEQYIDKTCVFDWEWSKDRQHGAPWAVHDIEGKKVVFWHFSHFTLTEDGYRDNTHNEWHPTREKGVKKFYDDYHEVIRSFM